MSRNNPALKTQLKNWIPADSSLLLAVSAGVDSMVLLDACFKNASLFRCKIHVAHVDHGLRDCSKEDANFVQEYCRVREIPCFLHTTEPPDGVNLEAWGREVRYAFFREILEKERIDWICTAHNANDCAETLLMRLLANKQPRTIIRKDTEQKILRPLLGVTREKIEKYAEQHGVTFREDPTNTDQSFLRNKVRHTLLPFLEENFDQRISEVLAERAEEIASDLYSLEHLLDDRVSLCNQHEFGSAEWTRLASKLLEETGGALRWRATEMLLRTELGYNLGRSRALLVAGLILGEIEQVNLPDSILLKREGNSIQLRNQGSN